MSNFRPGRKRNPFVLYQNLLTEKCYPNVYVYIVGYCIILIHLFLSLAHLVDTFHIFTKLRGVGAGEQSLPLFWLNFYHGSKQIMSSLPRMGMLGAKCFSFFYLTILTSPPPLDVRFTPKLPPPPPTHTHTLSGPLLCL